LYKVPYNCYKGVFDTFVTSSIIVTAAMKIQYTSEAIASLDVLETLDPVLFAAVNDELDRFEAEPGLTRWRRRGYAGVAPRAYGFDVRGPADDQLVLWQQIDDSTITVWYVGTPI
jgi:hypothetical protein